MEKTVMDWASILEAYHEESVERHDIDAKKVCHFGISPLDDALGGILPNDLVVIGADSGAGKSEMALQIAQHNAANGKRVILYFLEGGHVEAMARMKWRDMVREYFLNHRGCNVDLDYRRWRMNAMNEVDTKILLNIEAEVRNQYKEKYGDRLHIYEMEAEFTLAHLLTSMTGFCSFDNAVNHKPYFDIDMMIIDHLQYFSFPQGEKEIESITNIMRKVKSITQFHKVPVVLVSHLRKKFRERGLPDQEDFYGSSNIPKIASMAITISPDRDGIDFAKDLYPTFIRICKCRTGVSPSLAIRCNFNLHKREYEENYTLHRVNGVGEVQADSIPSLQLPRWAKRPVEITEDEAARRYGA
jgi:archaellum biogenesis ATPase FlaH